MSTSTALTQQHGTALANRGFDSAEVQLIRDTIAKGCDENELRLFLQVAKLKKLDPFTGQIRPVKRWDSVLGRESMTMQVGIDGFRAQAARTQELAGIDDPIYDDDAADVPRWAKVTVYRWSAGKGQGERIAYTATARYTEYVQRKKSGEPNSMWTKMPFLMLGKCAEALALRKAFPDELAGLYTDEEMGQADNAAPSAPAQREPVKSPQRKGEPQTIEATTKSTESKPPASQADNSKEIEGVVSEARAGKEDSTWMFIGNDLVVIEKRFMQGVIADGDTVRVRANKASSKRVGDYWQAYQVISVTHPQPKGDEEDLDRQFEEAEGQEPAQEEPARGLNELFDSGDVKKGSAVEAPKTIGKNRAQRLWAIMTQHSKHTGLSEQIVREKILSQLPAPIEHLSDLEFGMKDQMEKIFSGEVDWREFVGESE